MNAYDFLPYATKGFSAVERMATKDTTCSIGAICFRCIDYRSISPITAADYYNIYLKSENADLCI